MVNSGVYKITNIENGKCYIGSSKDVNKRIKVHIRELEKNIHDNTHLQSAWNKYGEDKFEFIVLEFVPDINILLEREQFWMDKYQCYKRDFGYNMLPVAGSSEGNVVSEETKWKISESKKGNPSSMAGKTHTKEARDKMSKSHKGKPSPMKGKTHSRETKRKLSEFNKGKPGYWEGKTHTQATKDKMSKAKKGKPSPMKGKTHSRETKDKISKSCKGKPSPRKGKILTEETRDKMAEANAHDWIVITPNGEEIRITNLRGFCKENNLNSSCMVQVSKGKQSHHKGWKCKKFIIGGKINE